MADPLADRLMLRIDEARFLYHRLVMLVAPVGTGKTAVLRDIHARMAAPLVNVNLELCRHMLDVTERGRALKLPRLLEKIVAESSADVVLLDNMEVLFEVSLKQDPLRLLQGLSRNRTIVAGRFTGVSVLRLPPSGGNGSGFRVSGFWFNQPGTRNHKPGTDQRSCHSRSTR